MIIFDDFLDCYEELKQYAHDADFSDVVNPVDGVTYPHICADLPEYVLRSVSARLDRLMHRKVEVNTIFMRRSPKGVHVPHMAHTDNSMGNYSLMIYLNDHPDGGTALLTHIDTGIERAPETQDLLAIVHNDQNNPSAWSIRDSAKMKQNRGFIFDAHEFHCALPLGGFGEGSDARTVLTVFFN